MVKESEKPVILPKELEKKEYDFLLPDETVLYQKGFLILTNKRVIKHGIGLVSKFFNLFDDEFQDLPYERISSIQKINKVNTSYFTWSFFLLLLMAFALVANSIPLIGDYAQKSPISMSSIAISLLVVAIIMLLVSFFVKIRVLRVYGEGTYLEYHVFDDEDARRIRDFEQKRKAK